MPPQTLRMNGARRRAVRNAILVAFPLLDASQVTAREEADVTLAVTDEDLVTDEGWLSPAEHARDVIEALGGQTALEAVDKRAFGRLLAEHTEPVETVREVDEPLQPGF